jgi:hypothetical protein
MPESRRANLALENPPDSGVPGVRIDDFFSWENTLAMDARRITRIVRHRFIAVIFGVLSGIGN